MQSTELTTRNRLAPSRNGHAEALYTLDSRIVADLGGTRDLDRGDARTPQPGKPRPRWRRRFVIGLVAAAVLWVASSKGIPFMREVLETVRDRRCVRHRPHHVCQPPHRGRRHRRCWSTRMIGLSPETYW